MVRQQKQKHVLLKSKKVFKFKTDEAEIHMFRQFGKRQIIRVLGTKRQANIDYYQHGIFCSLFPKNSLYPKGIDWGFSKRKWGMITKVVRERSDDYKKYQQWWYVGRKKGEPMSAPIKRHLEFAENVGQPFAKRVFEETGIQLVTDPVNICNVKGKPVFFEILGIDLEKIKEFLKENSIDNKILEKDIIELEKMQQRKL